MRLLTVTREGIARNHHLALPVFIFLGGVAIGGTAAIIVSVTREDPFELKQYFAIGCVGFLLAWWVIYFNYAKLGITNLRAFLRDKNPYRGDGRPVEHAQTQEDEDTKMVTKAAFSVGAQGILIAIIALFLDLVLSTPVLNDYQVFLRPGIVFLALLTILTMVFAIDILDTAANVYGSGRWTAFQYRRWFNSGVGPPFAKGGASYAYYGFALFSAYIVVGLMFFYPLLAGYGLAVYVYLGYPFLYGYERETNPNGESTVEIDESAGRGSVVLGLLFLGLTITIGILG